MKKYFSLVLFAHSIFALPFAFIGFFFAVYTTPAGFNWLKLLLMLLCMVFARNAAMAFNRYLDRHIDAANPRTAMRDIPAGRIGAPQALGFTIANSLLFIAATWFINPVCFYLSPVALAVVLGYSYTKRFTALCHVILGLGLGLAPLGAYLVVAGFFHIVPVLYACAVLFWVAGFDIIYALQDETFDREHSLNSIPVWLGGRNALRVSEVFHVLSAAFVVVPMFIAPLGWLYVAGTLFYCGLLVYQHRIVSPADLSRVDRAFMTTNGIASVVFACFFLLDLFFHFPIAG